VSGWSIRLPRARDVAGANLVCSYSGCLTKASLSVNLGHLGYVKDTSFTYRRRAWAAGSPVAHQKRRFLITRASLRTRLLKLLGAVSQNWFSKRSLVKIGSGRSLKWRGMSRVAGFWGRGLPGLYCFSAQRSCADCRLMPTARPMSAQEAPAAFAAATVLSNLWPAWLYSRAAASTPRMASDGAM
jgi:hypothetical protein